MFGGLLLGAGGAFLLTRGIGELDQSLLATDLHSVINGAQSESDLLRRIALHELAGTSRAEIADMLAASSIESFDNGDQIVAWQGPGQIVFDFHDGRLNEIENYCWRYHPASDCAKTGGSSNGN